MTFWRFLAFLVVWLAAGVAQAEEVLGKRLLVAFEDSARELPQQQIREAIVVELADAATVEAGGTEARAIDVPTDRLVVALDQEGLWIKYQGPRGLVERHLPLPERTEQVPVVVSLAVGNLVREEAFELQRELERRRATQAQAGRRPPTTEELAKRRAFAAEQRERAARHRTRQGSIAVFFGADAINFGPIDNPCTSSSKDPKLKCYADGELYQPRQPPLGGRIPQRTMLANVQSSVAFMYRFHPGVDLSFRTGVALVGDNTAPWFWELRNRINFNAAFDGRALRPFWYAGVGMMSSNIGVDAEVPADDESGDPAAIYTKRVRVVSNLGWFTLVNGLGLSASISEYFRVEAELGVIIHFPNKGQGPALHSAIGLAYDY